MVRNRGVKLSGEIELDESYFGGKHKGKRGHGAAGKNIVFGLLERDGFIAKWLKIFLLKTLMTHIEQHTRKDSVYFTDAFRGYQSLQRYGKHLMLNNNKEFVNKKIRNHINGIEGFGSYAKQILYHYRGVSRYHFPMYLKEIEYRYNHKDNNIFKLLLKLYFSYVSPQLPYLIYE